MGWDLNRAELPQEAKDFLSVLGGCGDEHQAARECGATDADVRAWGRLPDFGKHRVAAMEYYESWKGWDARQSTLPDPAAPPRPGAPDPHDTFAEDGRRGIGQRLRDWGRALVMAEPEQTEQPAGRRFIAIEDMTDQHVAEARRQMRERERPALATPQGVFRSSGDPASMPEPEPDPRTGWRPSVFGAPSSESFPEPNR